MNDEVEYYLGWAIRYAKMAIDSEQGGPFGAIVVKDKKIIGSGWNRVVLLNDPTAHAEIVAIRDAGRNIGSFSLEGSILYSSCEPCPMCLAATYWSGIREVYCGATRFDAEKIGFSDAKIYQEFNVSPEKRELKLVYVSVPEAWDVMKEWAASPCRVEY